MNTRSLSIIAAMGMLSLVACESGGDVRVGSASDSTAIDAIAGDKALVAQVMRRAHARGTLDDAMTLALQDSTLADELAAIVRADSRYAGNNASDASPDASASSSSSSNKNTRSGAARTTSVRTSTSSQQKGDVLDQTERKVQKANEKLDQAARIKKDAEEAKRTVDGILGR